MQHTLFISQTEKSLMLLESTFAEEKKAYSIIGLHSSGSLPFVGDVPFGQYFVYQVRHDCDHEHNNY